MPIVFIIDDDASVRQSMARLLRAWDLDTETFASAEEFLAREPFDGIGCILLDVKMPGVTGMDLQDLLAERGDETPIVFLTVYKDTHMHARAMKRGAVDFLNKPVDESDLLAAIRRALEHHARFGPFA